MKSNSTPEQVSGVIDLCPLVTATAKVLKVGRNLIGFTGIWPRRIDVKRTTLKTRHQLGTAINEIKDAQLYYLEVHENIMAKAEELQALLDEAYDRYAAAVNYAKEIIDETVDDMRDHYDLRSARWAEGEAGEQYHNWIAAWEDASAGLDLGDDPPVIEVPEPDFADLDALAELPHEVGET